MLALSCLHMLLSHMAARAWPCLALHATLWVSFMRPLAPVRQALFEFSAMLQYQPNDWQCTTLKHHPNVPH